MALVRQAFAPFCAELHVPGEPGLLVLLNVQHFVTRITGRLPGGASVLGVVAAMYPTAAVGGTPADAVDAGFGCAFAASPRWWLAPDGGRGRAPAALSR